VGEFMIAPATKTDKFVNVPEEIYSSSGKYIDPVRSLFPQIH
jgi:hypothetical protein